MFKIGRQYAFQLVAAGGGIEEFVDEVEAYEPPLLKLRRSYGGDEIINTSSAHFIRASEVLTEKEREEQMASWKKEAGIYAPSEPPPWNRFTK